MPSTNADVLIVGGGPFGLMLAIELGRRGVRAELFDEKQSTAFNPQANATQARTMEYYRRLGIADEIRVLGLPEDFPTDIAYFTRYAKHELARFKLPSARDAREKIKGLSGSWSAAELPHRVSQKFVERVLLRHAKALESVTINLGRRLTGFSELGASVVVEIEDVTTGERRSVKGRYLVAGDGARSFVRRQLGLEYVGETGVVRDFFGGRMLALYLRAPEFYRVVSNPPAWMNVTFNQERRAFMCAVDGKGEFAFHTQLRDGEDESRISDREALAMFQAAVGAPIGAELLSRGTWTAGHALVAERFQRARVMLGGDAVHLFTPAGGLGYNTAVEDAVNLGWKLAAVVKGVAEDGLLDTYEIERRPVAVRNTGYARAFAESLGRFVAKPGLEVDDDIGDGLRREAGAYLERHGKSEFNIPGVTFGTRYDGSPIILSDGAPIPPDNAHTYVPTASPGGRAPHLWLDDGRSLFDTFGFDWTLLRIGGRAPSGHWLRAAAATAGMQLQVVHLESDRLSALYEAPLALIRPDQIVAWRGQSDADADTVIQTVLGRGISQLERSFRATAR
ncbi:2-polyprenyl-6-methoxyphenol hydroxylase [Rhizobiales bacterium GAS113]|nr:2-polyprenyl-6-methoxyphenol hydroxylase [Rhizobiales bacterium GAS113]